MSEAKELAKTAVDTLDDVKTLLVEGADPFQMRDFVRMAFPEGLIFHPANRIFTTVNMIPKKLRCGAKTYRASKSKKKGKIYVKLTGYEGAHPWPGMLDQPPFEIDWPQTGRTPWKEVS